jgi:hypothetical protein
MSISDINKKYILCDGKIIRLEFSFENKEMNIELQIRKLLSNKKSQPCKVRLTFIDVTEFEMFEDFPTNGEYSDFIFTEISNENIYASFDPYGNSGQPNEQDNWIIKSKNVKLIEI